VLEFPDAYVRGYKDLGADGLQVMKLVAIQISPLEAPLELTNSQYPPITIQRFRESTVC